MIPSDRSGDKAAILDILYQSNVKLTSQAYIKEIKAQFSISTAEARKILQQLIEDQALSYHYLYGATYIEKSFLKPARITEHFTLKPLGYETQLDQNHIELTIDQGISFGSGQHPTTQLCLAAIEFCFFKKQMIPSIKLFPGADIGTGSGVLAMAMCRSGLASCRAFEIDPVSVNEAKKNIALNHLGEKVTIIDGYMQESKNTFSVICANLRLPTLKSLSDVMYESLVQHGIAIVSGVREWEKEELVTIYSEKGFESVWQQDEKNWSAFVLVKKVC